MATPSNKKNKKYNKRPRLTNMCYVKHTFTCHVNMYDICVVETPMPIQSTLEETV